MSAGSVSQAQAASAAAPGVAASEAAGFLMSEHRLRWVEAVPWVIAIAAYFLFPGYRLLATQILVMILFALSLDLLVGYAGIVSLGHTAFFGTGAYAAALMVSKLGIADPLLGLVAAGVCAAILGFVSGWIVLRTHGLTLLMLTMAFTIMLYELATDFDAITGGFDGINFTNSSILGLFALDQLYYRVNYFYVLAFLLIGFILVRTVVYSPFGRALVGMRENVRRMHAIGTPVHMRKVRVYVISAVMAGVAGALWVQVQGNVTTAVYSFELAGDVLIMVILGGAGRLYGAFIGAAVFKFLQSQSELWFGTDEPWWQLLLGVALVVTVLFARRGLIGVVEDVSAAMGFKRR
jgi:branched-chain amino acid transport system permease protein